MCFRIAWIWSEAEDWKIPTLLFLKSSINIMLRHWLCTKGWILHICEMLIWIYYFSPNIGYVSIDGHVPYATDKNFHQYLVIGPIARYAEDLKLTLSVMAGDKASKLKLHDTVILMLKWLELKLLIRSTDKVNGG